MYGIKSRLLVSLVMLSLVLLAFAQFADAHTSLPTAPSQDNQTQASSMEKPQAVPVPTPPAADYAQMLVPQAMATPVPVGYRPLPRPVATPPADR